MAGTLSTQNIANLKAEAARRKAAVIPAATKPTVTTTKPTATTTKPTMTAAANSYATQTAQLNAIHNATIARTKAAQTIQPTQQPITQPQVNQPGDTYDRNTGQKITTISPQELQNLKTNNQQQKTTPTTETKQPIKTQIQPTQQLSLEDYVKQQTGKTTQELNTLNGSQAVIDITKAYNTQYPTTQQNAPQSFNYTVQSGDEVNKIARSLGVSPEDISGYRSGDINKIFPGEVLTIKKYTPPAIIEAGTIPKVDATTGTSAIIPADDPANQFNTDTGKANPNYKAPLTETEKGYAGFLAEKTYASLYEQMKKDLGLGDLKTRITEANKALQDIQDKKIEEADEINSNPWISESLRLRKLKGLDGKYEQKIANQQEFLSQQQKLYDTSLADAQWAAKLTVDQYNTEKKFAYDAQKDAADLAKGTTDMQEYNYAVEQGYAGTLMDYQKEQANLKERIAKAGAATTIVPTTQDIGTKEVAEALGTVNQITNLLPDKDFDSAFGAEGVINRALPGSAAQKIAAEITNIKDRAAMGARGQLKGQGAVSNFEVQMLQNAQSALNFMLKPADARQALINFRGAIQTSTGGEAKIQATDSKGQSGIGYAKSRSISEMIQEGLSVKYID